MQTFKSSYGRKGIRVDDLCPTRAIRHHLGNVHVGTTPEKVMAEVRAEIRRMCDEKPAERHLWTESMVRDAVRFTRWQHEENRAEYRSAMGGQS